jgi:N4-gp56 family major capsid protein
MALTNFAALTDEQKTVWRRKVWRAARENMFIGNFLGTDDNSMIQRITELTRDEKGSRAVITLVTDLEDDGVAGDRFLEGNEEAMVSDDQVITIDQLRHAVRNKGRMADQKTVVKFRGNAMNNLSQWLSSRLDQMAFLTLSGISYAYTNNGAARTKQELANLDFASDVSAPTANRHFRWNGTSGSFEAGDTSNIAAADTISYDFVIKARTLAENNYIRPLRMKNGVEWYNLFLRPEGFEALKLDEQFQRAYQNARERSPNNPLFQGANVIYLDGMAIHKHRYVYNTSDAVSGSGKWGSGSDVDGQRALLCGAQSLAMADLGQPYWVEKEFDYGNQPGISVGKIAGMLKPKFYSMYNQSTEDFGVLALDAAL